MPKASCAARPEARSVARGVGMKIALYVGAGAGLVLLLALVLRADVPQMLHLWQVAGFSLLWLIPYRILFFVLYAMGWKRLLRPYDPTSRVGLANLVWVTSLREAVDRLLPVASVGGGVVGVRLLSWRGLGMVPVSATVIVEVVLTLIASYLYAVLAYLLMAHDLALRHGSAFAVLLLLTFAVPVACLLLLRYGEVFARLHGLIAPLVGIKMLAEQAAALDEQLRALLIGWRRLVIPAFLQFSALIIAAGEIWFTARLFGHPLSPRVAFILEGMSQAARHLAFFVPGGLGVQEGGLVVFGNALGLSTELALSISLAKRMREVLCGLPPLICWQWLEAKRLRVSANQLC
jgi:putative membrane protein